MTSMVLALALVAACGKSGSTGPTKSQDPGNVVYMKLTDKMTFDPPTITLKTSQRVTVVLENSGALKHNFAITSLKIGQDVAAGATDQVTFTAPDKPGQIAFFCNVPGHREAGMAGTLVIEK